MLEISQYTNSANFANYESLRNYLPWGKQVKKIPENNSKKNSGKNPKVQKKITKSPYLVVVVSLTIKHPVLTTYCFVEANEEHQK